ncbi:MAG TPA: hypothetical protein VH188_03575 [Chthoniobacterales bacterium]|jgi:hypothetical protein|nr:hypothetical protein [Chthoniobacterales bacterium]
MKFAIPPFADEDLDIAASATLGLETLLSVSFTPVKLVGTLTQGADVPTSVWGQDGAYKNPAGTVGVDMVMVCDNGVLSDEEIDITFDITIEGVGTPAGTAKAIFKPPTYAQNDTFNFPIGLAAELTVQGAGNAGKKIHSITGINVAGIVGGKAGNRFKILVLPDDFLAVACAMDKNPTPRSPKSVPIPCGYDAARWVKKGRSDPPTLELSAKYTSYGDGLPRVNGHRITAMLETVKDDRLLTERMVIGGWRPTITLRHGDGDSEDEARATGLFEEMAVFV